MSEKLYFNEAIRLAEAIRKRLPLEDYMREKGCDLHNAGAGRLRMRCPFHNENTPSFIVYLDTQTFHCFGCLHEDEMIWTNNGLVKIKDVNVGDLVIDINGSYQKILNKAKKRRTILRIKSSMFRRDIQISPDHHCLYVDKEQILDKLCYISKRADGLGVKFYSKYKNAKRNRELLINNGFASELKVGDYLLTPVIPHENRVDKKLNRSGLIEPNVMGPQANRIRVDSLPVDEVSARLYGLWLAEGSVTSNGRNLVFTYCMDELDTLADFTKNALMSVFGLKSVVYKYESKNTCEVVCSNKDISTLFGHFFGTGSANKRIPTEILFWNKNHQLSLINGYKDGDGCSIRRVTTTVSHELSYGIYMLSIQAGLNASMSTRPSYVDKNRISHKRTWINSERLRESASGFYANINDIEYYLTRISKIVEDDAEFDVYDIEVENTHTFLMNSCITHNCHVSGDVIKFARLHNNWKWFYTIRMLADRFGLKHTVTDSEIAERIFEDYMRSISSKRVYKTDANSLNYDISLAGKKLFRKYGHMYQVRKMIDQMFRVADKIFISEEESDINKMKLTLIPQMQKYGEMVSAKGEKIEELAWHNKLCRSCFLGRTCSRIISGTGNFFSEIMIVSGSPNDSDMQNDTAFHDSPVRAKINELGFSDNDVWFDYVSNCKHPVNYIYEEADVCKNLWLSKRIDIIKPKVIFALDEQSVLSLLGKKQVYAPGAKVLTKLFGLDIEVWLAYPIESSDFTNQLNELLSAYISK